MLNRFCMKMARYHYLKAVIEFCLSGLFRCIGPYKRHIICLHHVNSSLLLIKDKRSLKALGICAYKRDI